ncbi:3-deoxy-8-phosphooctulonate synthase [Alphaproteobacteria bacterium]|nr:3-deoxy-8-phosphooctulonate synthase [Alphaproteobacteria bacterium]MDC3270265.1 3-deoxy-8-phosphooctulonate synthase [Alphaproteobacteria bacterium]
MKTINLADFQISNKNQLILIAGPCVIESEQHSLMMAEKITNICQKLKVKFIYKSSFDKANRSSINSKRGISISEADKIFEKIKSSFNCPIITDVHNEAQCAFLGKSDNVDVLQIPAFLCRQTDLLISAAKTNKIINVKKGQFLSPHEVPNIFKKIESEGNNKIMITERGTSFGYNNLVNDFKSLDVMKSFSYPVIFDATHSVQEPGGLGETSGGKREFVTTLSKAAAAVGVAGIFIETHNDPDNAPSDGSNMLHLENLENLISKLIEFDNITKK